MSTGSLRFWISWEEPFDAKHGADPRPLKWPLPPSIVQYWCTGEGDGYLTVCAVVDVNGGEQMAKEQIEAHWAPRSWRFVEKQGWSSAAWMPPADRFPPWVKAKVKQ